MTILALDLGTKCGWAIHFGPDDIQHGVHEFRTGRFEGGGMRWLRFRKWLDEMHDTAGPLDAIYFEEVRGHKGVDAAHLYGGFLAELTAWAEKRSVPHQGVPVGTIKRHATGKGNAGKGAVIAAMEAAGFEPQDDNAADALALLMYATRECAR